MTWRAIRAMMGIDARKTPKMPGKGSRFQPGNKAALGHHKGRPRLDVASLADRVAVLVLEGDLTLIEKAQENPRSVSRLELHRAKERISRMCKGRVPTRIAIAGDEGNPNPVPFSYVSVASAPARGVEGEEQEAAPVIPEA